MAVRKKWYGDGSIGKILPQGSEAVPGDPPKVARGGWLGSLANELVRAIRGSIETSGEARRGRFWETESESYMCPVK